MENYQALMVNKSNKLSDARFDKMVEFKNEQRYAKRFQDSKKEFKASKKKIDFEVNFDKACKSIFVRKGDCAHYQPNEKDERRWGCNFLSFVAIM